ncbi:pyridoxamine 5'-phosphate oxidase family protein [Benzoatithermus flavus]|uniref:Pyridoxamine 5'-phosphate oxidase family protein n=1 Tax=Benzoatithermus flavus TaxID=3108223 RepID=A0ABU8XTY4_9PROT
MSDRTAAAPGFPITHRNRVRRLHERGRYDTAAIYAILDAAMLCHLAYVIDGQPYATPTAFWREGDRLYWHGSSASRMLRAQSEGIPVCLTVAHLDGLVLARSAFHHAVNYRSVMAFGRARRIEDPAEKLRAMTAFVERFFPGRTAALRPPTTQEVKATAILGMRIEQASAKRRIGPPVDDEADYVAAVWAGVIPLATVVGEPSPCPRLPEGMAPGPDLAAYAPGRRLDAALAKNRAMMPDAEP